MAEHSERFVGDIPHCYDRELGPVLFGGYAADLAARVSALSPRDVLETAAGTGILSRALRDALPHHSRLTVTDLNGDMLAVARNKFDPSEQVECDVGDALALPYGDASFDAHVCAFGIMFYPDQAASFRESRRLLRPGGHYVFSVWDSVRFNRFGAVADAVLRAEYPGDPPPFMRVPFGSYPIAPIKAMLSDAGFGAITIEIMARETVVPSWEQFAEGIVFGNPLLDQLRARGSAAPEHLQLLIRRALETEFGPGPTLMPLQAISYTAARD